MENENKCSLEEHKEIKAIKYCPECGIFMCNKCDNFHSSLFKKHHPNLLNNEEEIFTGICKEKNHYKLKYYCKNHNKLCCGLCIAKLSEDGEGQHKDCEVCYIEKIKDEKKNKLKENIKYLGDLQNTLNESIQTLKTIFDEIEKDKENLKIKVQNIFTKIRNQLNDREIQILLEIDNLFITNYFDENVIKKCEKLPKKIKLSLEKGKLIDKQWDNNNLYSNIHDCINIETNIKNINIINEIINKCDIKNKIEFNFSPKETQLKEFMKSIGTFGKIYYNIYSFKNCPTNIEDNRKYVISGYKNNIITKTGYNGWMGTICENELDKSIEEHKWKIKILKSQNKSIMVGVATSDFDILSSTQNTCGWYLSCDNSKLYSGPPFKYDCLKTNLSKVKDEIIVVMNMKKRTVKFIINNEDKGDSFKDIPIDKPLFPAVCLVRKDDSVEISN